VIEGSFLCGFAEDISVFDSTGFTYPVSIIINGTKCPEKSGVVIITSYVIKEKPSKIGGQSQKERHPKIRIAGMATGVLPYSRKSGM